MGPTGIRRKIDDLGRVVIPAGIRRSLEIREGDPLNVSVDGDRIVLSKPRDRCVFCATEAGLAAFRGKSVCVECITSVGRLGAEPVGPTPPPWSDAAPGDAGRGEALIPAPFGDAYDPASSTAW